MDRIFQLSEQIIVGRPLREDIFQECISLINSTAKCMKSNIIAEIFAYLKEKSIRCDYQQLKRLICAPSIRHFLADVRDCLGV